MPVRHLSTSKIARAVGCHPNTVRMYEVWGLLPPVPRSRNGYRVYTQAHLDQMRLARTALNTVYPGKAIRQSAIKVIKTAAAGDLGSALELAYHHLALVRAEQAQAETAAALLERWAQGVPIDPLARNLHIGETARLLGLSVDILHNWERSGLVVVPRQAGNGYRLYGQEQIARLRVIRMLRSAGYSLMAILRMMLQLDAGITTNLRQALDTPRPDEDVLSAADRWLSTLAEMEICAHKMIAIIEERIQKERSETI
ncbi:MAG TPA: MerR family transcriptional regulator [Anaerolineaceae bacterium]